MINHQKSKRSKRILFFLICILGLNLFIVLLYSSIKVLNNCSTKLLLTADFKYASAFYAQKFDFILSIFITGLILYLWSRFIYATLDLIISLISTNIFQSGLKVKKNDNYYFITNKSNLAFTAGIISPKVFISKNLKNTLSQKEFEILLSHELTHKSEYDPLQKIIVRFLKLSLPYIPKKNEIFYNFEIITEILADESTFGSKDMLLNLYQKLTIQTNPKLSLNNFVSKMSRVGYILKLKKIKIAFNIFALILTISASNFILISVIKAEYPETCNDYNKCIAQNHSSSVLQSEQLCKLQLFSKEVTPMSIYDK